MNCMRVNAIDIYVFSYLQFFLVIYGSFILHQQSTYDNTIIIYKKRLWQRGKRCIILNIVSYKYKCFYILACASISLFVLCTIPICTLPFQIKHAACISFTEGNAQRQHLLTVHRKTCPIKTRPTSKKEEQSN